jgi:hypothetical protein
LKSLGAQGDGVEMFQLAPPVSTEKTNGTSNFNTILPVVVPRAANHAKKLLSKSDLIFQPFLPLVQVLVVECPKLVVPFASLMFFFYYQKSLGEFCLVYIQVNISGIYPIPLIMTWLLRSGVGNIFPLCMERPW